MRNCNKCGNEINQDDLFCTKCGNRTGHVCKKCGNTYGADDKFCEVCGNKLAEDVDIKFVVPNNEQRQANHNRNTVLIIAVVIVIIAAGAVGAYYYQNKINKDDKERTAKSNSVVSVEQNKKSGKIMLEEKSTAAIPGEINGNNAIVKAEQEYLTYTDSKFGYSIDYPVDFKFREDLSSENLNSKVFSNGEGQLTVFGNNTLQNETIKDYFENALFKVSARHAVGYNHLGDTWYVITYKSSGGSIHYSKTLWGAGSNNNFRFSYPSSKKHVYDPIVEHIEQNFYRGNTEVTH